MKVDTKKLLEQKKQKQESKNLLEKKIAKQKKSAKSFAKVNFR